MADNTSFDMTAVLLQPAIDIAFSTAPGGKATHYKVDTVDYGGIPVPRLILAWHESAGKDFIPFLAPLTKETAKQVISDWLKEQKYHSQPDHDGDNERSFRIYNGSWGYIDGNEYTFVAVEPRWAMYGK